MPETALLQPIPLTVTDHGHRGTLPACAWFTSLQLLRIAGSAQLTTGDEESCALLLAGTFDLQGGPSHWGGRGARTAPLQGRPLAVFLPPRTLFAAGNGHGEILIVGARQPKADAPVTGLAAFSIKPLLPLSGSGKSFDPGTGEWRPAETFAANAELLPPRRIERTEVGTVAVERVFPVGYKAATLCIDEAALAAGAQLDVGAIPDRPAATELLVYVRSEGRVSLHCGGTATAVTGEGAFVLAYPRGAPQLRITADAGACYVMLAHAGK
ncbi:MAG TPA: hypothetical protein VK348_04400 [Planctomycetota bacterium]|nr:hypothetical protein [Planctomycetota bacterium]